MNDVLNDLSELKNIKDNPQTDITSSTEETKEAAYVPAIEREPVMDDLGRTYATGKRKDAIARVWLKPGNGNIQINGKSLENYFLRDTLKMIVNQPFTQTERGSQYDAYITVTGGGLSGQAGAVKHGVSVALNLREPELRPILKKAGFLTRDSRVVERKKYGLRKARRSRQFSKR